MQANQKCKLCNNQIEWSTACPLNNDLGANTIMCRVCGGYILATGAKHFINSDPAKDKLHLISGVTRNYFERHEHERDKVSYFIITEKMVQDESEFEAKILSQVPKSVLDKAALLLQYIARKSSHPGDNVLIYPSQDYPICFCKNEKELRFYINHLRDIGDIKAEGTMRDYSLSLTAEGWQKIESMERPNLESKQAFVAMWFDESLKEIFTKGIEPLEKDTGFEMYRADQEPFNEKICDRIIADIRKSRFLIADVTGLRHAVFFEAGYAMGLGLPVIFTCKEGTEIEGCFDTRQYNHIVWENAKDLKSKLKDRILATIGKAQN